MSGAQWCCHWISNPGLPSNLVSIRNQNGALIWMEMNGDGRTGGLHRLLLQAYPLPSPFTLLSFCCDLLIDLDLSDVVCVCVSFRSILIFYLFIPTRRVEKPSSSIGPAMYTIDLTTTTPHLLQLESAKPQPIKATAAHVG